MKSMLRAIGTANWLRLGIRRRIISFFYPSTGSSSSPFSLTYHGITYKGDIANAQEWHVYFFGGYELKESRLLEDLLSVMDDPVAFDIGANLGGHAFMIAQHAKEVHAFEPFGPLADRIYAQTSYNNVKNVHLHRFGLGEYEEIKPYYLDESSNNSGTGSFLAEHAGAPVAGYLQIRNGDNWATKQSVDLIKIDVEGYEAQALTGLSNTLKLNRPIIMMEVTESSWSIFETYGGVGEVIPFEFEIYEICNPSYHFGLFQSRSYQLTPRKDLVPRKASFNVLIVPSERNQIVAKLL